MAGSCRRSGGDDQSHFRSRHPHPSAPTCPRPRPPPPPSAAAPVPRLPPPPPPPSVADHGRRQGASPLTPYPPRALASAAVAHARLGREGRLRRLRQRRRQGHDHDRRQGTSPPIHPNPPRRVARALVSATGTPAHAHPGREGRLRRSLAPCGRRVRGCAVARHAGRGADRQTSPCGTARVCAPAYGGRAVGGWHGRRRRIWLGSQ
jgi:hypothetical protein